MLVRHVLAHTAGVLGFDGAHEITRMDGTGWDNYEAISAGLAASVPSWEPGTKHGYHALSVGWLIAELVKRISGTSLGQFFRNEVGDALGLECWIGTPPEEMDRRAQVHPMHIAHLPRFLRSLHEVASVEGRDPSTLLGRAFLADGSTSAIDELAVIANSPPCLQPNSRPGAARALRGRLRGPGR